MVALSTRFENSYAEMSDRFRVETRPAGAPDPRLIRFNSALAEAIGFDAHGLDDKALARLFAGNEIPDTSRPIAMAYAGHQFGSFVPQLGDGRAVLIGEIVGPDGVRRDIQLKGAGRTVFSRGGDGRSALGPVLREYIVSEAMAVHGVPTTRSLAAVATGEEVARETMLPGGVLTRVARSHLRVGTFQFFAARGDTEGVRQLADYAIARHYPDAREAENPYLAFFAAVLAAQADLIARWMALGFIHGVMNTDNMAISGETIDYGPCAFMDAYHPGKVFSSIDAQGRYAYSNQPGIAQWNLARLAEALLPLLDGDTDRAVTAAQDELAKFGPLFENHFHAGLRRKIGLANEEDVDVALIRDLLKLMADDWVDFTLGFRALNARAAQNAPSDDALARTAAFPGWETRWRERLARDPLGMEERAGMMRIANPLYIPRNHRVEQAIQAAVANDDYQPFHDLVDVLARPFDAQPGRETYAAPPRPEELVERTFCGT